MSEMSLDEALEKCRRYATDKKHKDMPSVSRTMLAAYTAEKERSARLEKLLDRASKEIGVIDPDFKILDEIEAALGDSNG